MKIIYNNLIPIKGFRAINILGFIFARKEFRKLSSEIIEHEKIHTEQMKELLFVIFYLWYIVEWLIKFCVYGRRAYYNISFEREAYQNADVKNYLRKRKRYAFWKCLL